MAEGDLGRFPVVEPRALREKRKQEITGEKIANYIEELRGYLRDWEIMPDSFILAEDYQQKDFTGLNAEQALAALRNSDKSEDQVIRGELERVSKNKLRTAWFNILYCLSLSCRAAGLNVPAVQSAFEEYHALKKEESLAALNVAVDRFGEQYLRELGGRAETALLKKIKKELAPQFLARKIALIAKIEDITKLVLTKLNEKLCAVSD